MKGSQLYGFRVVSVVLLACLAGGCITMRIGYEASTRIARADEPDVYIVEFQVFESSMTGEPDLLSAPRLRVKAGQKGEITIGDEHSSLKCSALVLRKKEKVSAMTRVRVKEGRKEVWTSQQTVALHLPFP